MNGENLFNAAAVMYKAGEEIDAMLEKMLALLLQRFKSIDWIREFKFMNDDADESSDWVYCDLINNYGIYKKGDRATSPSAYLGIQIKLCDTKEAEIVGPQSLLYVLFSPGEWAHDEFLLHNAVSAGYELEDGCLWRRYDDDEDRSLQRSWEHEECAFVVSLTAINTPDDIRKLIVDPIYYLMTSGLNAEMMDQRLLRFRVDDSEVILLP